MVVVFSACVRVVSTISVTAASFGVDAAVLTQPGGMSVIRAWLAVGSAGLLGSNEERGWRLAGTAIPILFVAWSLWVLGLGVAFF
jgi:hypothetical protein